VRCERCGARNAEGAAWCTQCYVSFASPGDEPGVIGDEPGRTVDGDGGTGDARARDVRVVGGDVEWRCRRCDGWSALAAASCATCAAPREGFGGGTATGPARTVAPAVALGASLLLPGAGHLLVGRTGTGVARAVLWLLWSLPGVAAVRGTEGLRALPGVVLLLGAVTLWAATLVDVRRVIDGDPPELLATRTLTWLVGGVVLAAVAAVLVATTTAR
jgi:hypothetical protein